MLIKENTDKVRLNLFIEDLNLTEDLLKQYEYLKALKRVTLMVEDQEEKVYMFHQPIQVPNFGVFYSSPIKSVNDPYLARAFRRVLYLNPNPSALMQKKIVEEVLKHFVVKVKKESEVLLGELVEVPAITYEAALPVFQTVLSSPVEEDELGSSKFVFFQKDSKLSRVQKIKIAAGYRYEWTSNITSELIHNIAEYLHEVDQVLHVTPKRIGAVREKLSPYKVSKYMSNRTKMFIEEVNASKHFKTEKSKEKFLKYMEYRNIGYSTTEAASKVSISNSTRVEFTQLEEIIVIN